jgi:hypothetical protein
MLAIGMAFAVLIDASLVRMILVPAVMSLLGPRAWWLPRWLAPLVPNLQLEGSSAPPPAPGDAAPAPSGAAPGGAVPDGAVPGQATPADAPSPSPSLPVNRPDGRPEER